jgi:hypothetical protein
MGPPKSMQKGRTLLKLEKDQNNGGSQKKMLGLKKIMRKSTKPIKIRTPRVVTRHIPSKPQKDHSSKQDQERKE